jgi:Putative metal-binding motif
MKKLLMAVGVVLSLFLFTGTALAVDGATVEQIQNEAAEAKNKAADAKNKADSNDGRITGLYDNVDNLQGQIDDLQGQINSIPDCVCDVSYNDIQILIDRIETLEQSVLCIDSDMDGYGEGSGCLGPDCNDGNNLINPGISEVCDDGIDNDCDGLVDCEDITDCDGSSACLSAYYFSQTPCDNDLALDSADPLDFARAIGLCEGVESAEWVKPDGTADPNVLGKGILSNFGPNIPVIAGNNLGAISSGTARRPTDIGYVDVSYDAGYISGTPSGFPIQAPQCPALGESRDGIGLRVYLTVPENATGFSFYTKFYTHDFPDWVCSTFNDSYVVIMNPAPPGSLFGNIAFDNQGNPISVNSGFIEECSGPVTAGGIFFPCPLGSQDLVGTGFDNFGATGWLEVKAPVESGTAIELFFVIWDSGDGSLDSTVLIDNFRWIGGNYTGGVVTEPAPAD